MTTIFGRDDSTIDLTAKRVANRLNTKSEDPTPNSTYPSLDVTGLGEYQE
ncbi:hypothetical protein KAX17_07175 [Candidatus Bipolaricaulota bacterium]|nr:hypothetical protein [Candidatus Bipolaricaulota bacterium]